MSTLILSGWAQPADALAPLAEDPVSFDYSDYPSPEAAIEALKNIKHTTCVGWSTGGYVALLAVAQGAIAPEHLTLIAAPYRFVGREPKGMDPLTFQQFRANYVADPARTKERFHALVAKGDSAAHEVLGKLRHHYEVENTARWLPWLDALGAQSFAELPLASAPPTLIIHGMNDAVIPHAQGVALAKLMPHAQLNSWPDTGHAPHLHDAARLRAEMAAHRAAAGVA